MQEQHGTLSKEQMLKAVLRPSAEGYDLSMFRDRRATADEIAVQAGRILVAYPNLTNGFYNELMEALKRRNMSYKQLVNTINRAIEQDKYANISSIVNYDVKIKLYDYENVCANVNKHPFTDYYLVIINGNGYRILKSEAEEARLKYGFNIEAFRQFIKQ